MAPPKNQPAPVADDTMSRLMQKLTVKASDGVAPKGIRRRTADVPIDPALCEPDTFDAPFTVGIESLPPAMEMAAMKEGGDGVTIGLALAKRALRTVDGRPLKKVEIDVLWDALGFQGRLVVCNAYLAHCTGVADGGALGKSLGIEVG